MSLAFSDYCVYTIVHPVDLAGAADRATETIFRESKPWVSGRRLWQQAQAAGVGFPVLLGDATDCSRLAYWGLLSAVELDGDGTQFTVDRVRRLPEEHSPQELVLRSSGKPIAPNFIKPYAICRTPDFLPEQIHRARRGK